MYEYLRYMSGQDIDVHIRNDTPMVIGGVLADVGEGYLVVRHQFNGEYVIPFESIKLILITSLKEREMTAE